MEAIPDNAHTATGPASAAPKRYEPEPDAPPDDEAAERVPCACDDCCVCDGGPDVAVRSEMEQPGSGR